MKNFMLKSILNIDEHKYKLYRLLILLDDYFPKYLYIAYILILCYHLQIFSLSIPKSIAMNNDEDNNFDMILLNTLRKCNVQCIIEYIFGYNKSAILYFCIGLNYVQLFAMIIIVKYDHNNIYCMYQYYRYYQRKQFHYQCIYQQKQLQSQALVQLQKQLQQSQYQQKQDYQYQHHYYYKYQQKPQKPSNIACISICILSLYQTLYEYILFIPMICFYLGILLNDSPSDIQIILAIFGILYCLLYKFLLFDVKIIRSTMPIDYLDNRFSSKQIMTIAMILYSLCITLTSSYNAQYIKFLGMLLLGITQVFYYLKDIDYIQHRISKLYLFLSIALILWSLCLIIKLAISISSTTNSANHAIFTFSLIIMMIFNLYLYKYIYDKIASNVLNCTNYNNQSKGYIDYSIRTILHYIKYISLKLTTLQKLRISYYIITFIKNHSYNCHDLSCICKSNINNNDKHVYEHHKIEDYDISMEYYTPEKIYNKTPIMRKYKNIICLILNQILNNYINHIEKNTICVSMRMLQCVFLFYEMKTFVSAFIKLADFRSKAIKMSIREKLMMNVVEEEFEYTFKSIQRMDNVLEFKAAIYFYDNVELLKNSLSTICDNYIELYKEIANDIIDLDNIITICKKIIALKKKITLACKTLLGIHPLNIDLLSIIQKVIILDILDPQVIKKFEKQIELYIMHMQNQDGSTISKIIDPNNIHKYDISNVKISDILDKNSGLIFASINNDINNIGDIKAYTRNALKIFNYKDDTDFKKLNINMLMPKMFREKHDGYIKTFLKRSNNLKNFKQNIVDIYGIDTYDFIFPINILIKLEIYNNELCLISLIRKYINDYVAHILLDDMGNIINYNQNFYNHFISIHSVYGIYDQNKKYEPKMLQGINIALFIPKLIEIYLQNHYHRSSTYQNSKNYNNTNHQPQNNLITFMNIPDHIPYSSTNSLAKHYPTHFQTYKQFNFDSHPLIQNQSKTHIYIKDNTNSPSINPNSKMYDDTYININDPIQNANYGYDNNQINYNEYNNEDCIIDQEVYMIIPNCVDLLHYIKNNSKLDQIKKDNLGNNPLSQLPFLSQSPSSLQYILIDMVHDIYQKYELNNVNVYITRIKLKHKRYAGNIQLNCLEITTSHQVKHIPKISKILKNTKNFISNHHENMNKFSNEQAPNTNILVHPYNTNNHNHNHNHNYGSINNIINVEDSFDDTIIQNNFSFSDDSQANDNNDNKPIERLSNENKLLMKSKTYDCHPNNRIFKDLKKVNEGSYKDTKSYTNDYKSFTNIILAKTADNDLNKSPKNHLNNSSHEIDRNDMPNLIKYHHYLNLKSNIDMRDLERSEFSDKKLFCSDENTHLASPNLTPVSTSRFQENKKLLNNEYPSEIIESDDQNDNHDDEQLNIAPFMNKFNELSEAICYHKLSDKSITPNSSQNFGQSVKFKEDEEFFENSQKKLNISNKKNSPLANRKPTGYCYQVPKKVKKFLINLDENSNLDSIKPLKEKDNNKNGIDELKSSELATTNIQKTRISVNNEEQNMQINKADSLINTNKQAKIEKIKKKPTINLQNQMSKLFLHKESINKSHIVDESTQTSTQSFNITATKKLYRNLLTDNSTPHIIQKLNNFGLCATLTILVLLTSLFLSFSIIIMNYIKFARTANFTCPLTFALSQFHKDLEKSQMVIDNLWDYSLESLSQMQNRSKESLFASYDEYKMTLRDKALNMNLQGISRNFHFENYNIELTQNDGSETLVGFMYALTLSLQHMAKLLNNNLTTMTSDIQTKDFFWLNYKEYFRVLAIVTTNLFQDLYGVTKIINVNKYAQTILIINLSISAIFLLFIYPIYRKIETNRDNGLSLFSTFHIDYLKHEITTIQDVKFRLNNADNNNESQLLFNETINNIDTIPKPKNQQLRGTLNNIYSEKSKNHDAREWKKKKMSVFLIIGLLALIFSLLTSYFVAMTNVINSKNSNFLPLTYEFDLMTDIWSFVPAAYAISYRMINLYNITNQTTRQEIFKSYDYVIYKLNGRVNDCMEWNTNLPNYLANPDISDSYKSTIISLFTQNICDFIVLNKYHYNRCKNILDGNAKLGWCGLYQYIHNNLWEYTNTASSSDTYNINMAYDIIHNSTFEEMDIMLDYIDIILRKYQESLQNEILRNLYGQHMNGVIFLAVGIAIVALFYFFCWKPFIKKMKNDFKLIKKLYNVLPIDMIISNNYLKKYLKGNCANCY